jgi:hypothetical protein
MAPEPRGWAATAGRAARASCAAVRVSGYLMNDGFIPQMRPAKFLRVDWPRPLAGQAGRQRCPVQDSLLLRLARSNWFSHSFPSWVFSLSALNRLSHTPAVACVIGHGR